MIHLIGVISGILMLIASNIPTWLKPVLIRNNFPDWFYNDFSLYVTIYLAATALNSWIVSRFSDNSGLTKKIATQKKEHRAALKKVTAEHEEKHTSLKRQKDGVINELKGKVRDLNKELDVKKEQIRRYSGDLNAEMERCCSLEAQLRTRSYNTQENPGDRSNAPTDDYLAISGRQN